MPDITALGYPFPEDDDQVDVAGDVQSLAEAVDTAPGVASLSQAQLDNLAGGSVRSGRVIFNSTAKRLEVMVDGSPVHVETTVGAQAKASTAKSGAEATAAAALAAHEADTTNIHGIVDTSALATKAYADSVASTAAASAAAAAAASLVNAAPATLDTLGELAAALGDDANYAATVTTALGQKASTASLTAHTSATTSVHGIANTANLVLTSDSRLADTRTPTSHAASHASTGTDPVSPASIGAAASVHAHSGADITSGTVGIGQLPTGTTSATVATGDHTHAYAATVHSHSGYIEKALVTAAGDLIVAEANATVTRLPLGLSGQVLSADPAATGAARVKWIDPPGIGGPGATPLADFVPQDLGTAASGSSVYASRGDHVHAHPYAGLGIQVGGTAPVSSAGYLWVDTSVEA